MQLLILILKKSELMENILQELAKADVKGGTVIEGTGMANALVNMEDLPMFGMLRHMISDQEKEVCKVMMFVLQKEQEITARKIIKDIVGNIYEPNTGIMFSLPINNVEGFGE
ncbi:MAG TPA: hypothetical protein VJZ06_03760 [Mobilitalea sp.]|nr:hypothetical protein [Mobilitalea sp.]